MEVFATFDVMDSKGVKVAEGHKASFCLEDNQCMPGVKPFYACANFGDQGISVNCSDIYRHNIDCQWVDISELNPGMYTFKVSTLLEGNTRRAVITWSALLPFILIVSSSF
jgi:lysyl oxidase-like protein 2/3/4